MRSFSWRVLAHLWLVGSFFIAHSAQGDFQCANGRCGGGFGGKIDVKPSSGRGFAEMGGYSPVSRPSTPSAIWDPAGYPATRRVEYVNGREQWTAVNEFGHVIARADAAKGFDKSTGLSHTGLTRVAGPDAPDQPTGTIEDPGKLVKRPDGWYQQSGGKLLPIRIVNAPGTAVTQTSPGVFKTVPVQSGDVVVDDGSGKLILADATTRKELLTEYQAMRAHLAKYPADQQTIILAVIKRQGELLAGGPPPGSVPMPPPGAHDVTPDPSRPPVEVKSKFDEFKSIFADKAKVPEVDKLVKFIESRPVDKDTPTAMFHMLCVSSNDPHTEARLSLYLGVKDKKPMLRMSAGFDTADAGSIRRDWDVLASTPSRSPILKEEKGALVGSDDDGSTKVTYDVRTVPGDPSKVWVKMDRKVGTYEATYYCGKGEVKTGKADEEPPPPPPLPKREIPKAPEGKVNWGMKAKPEGDALKYLQACQKCHDVGEGKKKKGGFAIDTETGYIQVDKANGPDAAQAFEYVAKNTKDMQGNTSLKDDEIQKLEAFLRAQK